MAAIPLVQRAPSASGSFTPSPSNRFAPPTPTGSARSFAGMFGEPAPAEAAIQRAVAIDEVETSATPEGDGPAEPTGAASSGPATAGSAAAGTVGAPSAAGGPPADLDEMARRLYEPLAARLRAELWLDRERAGVIGDV